jgi:prepilin-type processing-associated H-X9-DG protein
MPLANNWTDALHPYLAGFGPGKRPVTQLACPSRINAQYGYAYHEKLERQSYTFSDKAEKVILFFDSDMNRRNAADNGSSLPNPPRHYDLMNNIGYLDGHVKAHKIVDFKDKWNSFRPALRNKSNRPKASTR